MRFPKATDHCPCPILHCPFSIFPFSAVTTTRLSKTKNRKQKIRQKGKTDQLTKKGACPFPRQGNGGKTRSKRTTPFTTLSWRENGKAEASGQWKVQREKLLRKHTLKSTKI